MGAPVVRAAALAIAGAAVAAWLGLLGFVWTDYEYTAIDSVRALLAGPEPALSAPPSGAWTRAITDAAAQAGPGTAPERPPAAD